MKTINMNKFAGCEKYNFAVVAFAKNATHEYFECATAEECAAWIKRMTKETPEFFGKNLKRLEVARIAWA